VVFAPLHDPAVIDDHEMMERFLTWGIIVLRYGVSRDDAGGGDYLCDPPAEYGRGVSAVGVSWIELRVDCGQMRTF